MTRIPTELFDCERVNAYLESYLLGQVPPPERRGMRQHIHRCPVCLQKVLARDPLQVFAPLADQTPRGEVFEGFWPASREGMEKAETRGRSRRFWLRAAAALLVLAGAAAALSLLPKRPAPLPIVATGGEAVAPGAPVEALPPLPQTVEQVRTSGSRDVQVYTMSYTGGPAPAGGGDAPVAELVLIVDKGLDL